MSSWRWERVTGYKTGPKISKEANDEAPDSIDISCFNGGMSVIFLSRMKVLFH